jgi:hypothetical protein
MSLTQTIASPSPSGVEDGEKDAMDLFLERQQYLLQQPLPCGRRVDSSILATAAVSPALSAPVKLDLNILRKAVKQSFDTAFPAMAAHEAAAATARKTIPDVVTSGLAAPTTKVPTLKAVIESAHSAVNGSFLPCASLPVAANPSQTPTAPLVSSVPAVAEDAARPSIDCRRIDRTSITIHVQSHRILMELAEQEMLPIVIRGGGRKPTCSPATNDEPKTPSD